MRLQVFIAGIIGAVGTDAFISVAHHTSPVKVWQFIASSAVGGAAFTSAAYVWLGIAMHVLVALFWAGVYAYAWSRVSSLRNWIAGGVVLGVVVTVCMDFAMAFRHVLEPQTPASIVFALITNVVFYGLLVAWYLSHSLHSRNAAGAAPYARANARVM